MTHDDDGPTDHVQTRFGSDQSPSESVVRALAALDGVEPASLDPLYQYVDPDALDALFEKEGTDHVDLVVSFSVDEYQVTVREDGTTTVRKEKQRDELE
jgi:hypothetical protein